MCVRTKTSEDETRTEKAREPTIIFNASKNELCTPSNGFKLFHRRLRSSWRVLINKDEITSETLSEGDIFIIGGPRRMFSAAEFEAITRFMNEGGSLFCMVGEGGEVKANTNINALLEQYGVVVNNDAVTRNVYYKYFHPKEVLISNGVLNREFNRASGKRVPGTYSSAESSESTDLQFVFPFGATVSVQKPSVPVLSTGSVSFPFNRPICSMYEEKKKKLCVLGSVDMFSDRYLEKEENTKVLDVITKWLSTNEISLNSIDAEDPEITDYHYLPNTAELASRLRSCLLKSDDVPRDFTKLFDHKQYTESNEVLPEVLQAYDQLKVPHEVLTLIQPTFETPLPPLEPAVFPPMLRELPAPALDLFDLDEQFSSEAVRLAQITNKCGDDDLEYFVRECGEILNVTKNLTENQRTGKDILEYIFRQVVEYKKMNQE